MKLSFKKTLLIALPVAMLSVSCKKDKTPEPSPTSSTPTYTVPTTYNFTSVDFSSSTKRIAMLGEITTYIKTAHTSTATPVLDAQKMKDMYANLNSQFIVDPSLNTSGFQLKDKTANTYNLQSEIESNLTDLGTVTQTTPTASNGTAGKLTSGTAAYIVDGNGVEYKEFVEKGLMAAVFYNQATTILTNISSYDNSTVTNGTTAQEHAWDEAFGYFGVPVDFPTTVTGLKNWGSYCNSVSNALDAPNVNSATSVNVTMMNAFLKGRAAITNKDNTVRDAQKDIVIKTWEKVAAGRFITYVKQAKTNFADDGKRNHALSEGLGFIKAFKYNPSKTITDAQINTLLGYFGSNMYQVTTTNMDNAINEMASIFGLDATKL
ncbi:MAG: DUF4856 domain-containing protein [Bacteroidota bacterium]|nr:DUF4856 domain-containing protein [Bacteroidota bacterium]